MSRDPWYFQRWAFEQKVGNPVRKAVLSMLSMMADTSTGRGEVKQDTLAQGVEASERAVRGHLKALEEARVIARRPQFRRDRGRRGDEFLLLAPGVTEWPDGEPVQPAPDAGGGGTDPYPPRGMDGSGQELPPENGHASGQGESARDRRALLPDDFPDDLRPHARHVYRVLKSVAEQHNARRVWPMALGTLMMRHRRKPLVATAHDLAVWAVDPPRPIKDVVATYGTFLGKTRDLQRLEPIDAEGVPVDAPSQAPAGVTSLLGGRGMSNADRVEAQIQALRAASSASGSDTVGST